MLQPRWQPYGVGQEVSAGQEGEEPGRRSVPPRPRQFAAMGKSGSSGSLGSLESSGPEWPGPPLPTSDVLAAAVPTEEGGDAAVLDHKKRKVTVPQLKGRPRKERSAKPPAPSTDRGPLALLIGLAGARTWDRDAGKIYLTSLFLPVPPLPLPAFSPSQGREAGARR